MDSGNRRGNEGITKESNMDLGSITQRKNNRVQMGLLCQTQGKWIYRKIQGEASRKGIRSDLWRRLSRNFFTSSQVEYSQVLLSLAANLD